MDSFNQAIGFQYNPNSNTECDTNFSGILEIYVHHARDIRNICIYRNQDVYAKFSFTYNPDVILSTRIINDGGNNPEFNENLVMQVAHIDAVLKCEIWMLSRAKNYLEDQLLGFALVPVSSIVGKGEVTQDYSLSSTQLIHSPAGTVKLTLSLITNVLLNPSLNSFHDSVTISSISSEVVLLDRNISEVDFDPLEYSRLEFPDINAVKETQHLVSQYFELSGSFLHLGACNNAVEDYEMAANSSEENRGDSVTNDTPISRNKSEAKEEKTKFSDKEDGKKEGNMCRVKFGQVFSAPLGNVNLETEQSMMQQQIVDMYMSNMQEFTESLAKMKLPMDLDKPEDEDRGDLIQNNDDNSDAEKKKKDGSRVFYGSQAFF